MHHAWAACGLVVNEIEGFNWVDLCLFRRLAPGLLHGGERLGGGC